jgi:hypothetical protein
VLPHIILFKNQKIAHFVGVPSCLWRRSSCPCTKTSSAPQTTWPSTLWGRCRPCRYNVRMCVCGNSRLILLTCFRSFNQYCREALKCCAVGRGRLLLAGELCHTAVPGIQIQRARPLVPRQGSLFTQTRSCRSPLQNLKCHLTAWLLKICCACQGSALLGSSILVTCAVWCEKISRS